MKYNLLFLALTFFSLSTKYVSACDYSKPTNVVVRYGPSGTPGFSHYQITFDLNFGEGASGADLDSDIAHIVFPTGYNISNVTVSPSNQGFCSCVDPQITTSGGSVVITYDGTGVGGFALASGATGQQTISMTIDFVASDAYQTAAKDFWVMGMEGIGDTSDADKGIPTPGAPSWTFNNTPTGFGSNCTGNCGGVESGTGTGIIWNTAYHCTFEAAVTATLDATLPLNFGYFNALSLTKEVQLKWNTYNESNNNYFEIERSSDGKVFQPIGTIQSKGNNTNENIYSFTDINPKNGKSYYRIKQIDFNGKFTYSKTISSFIYLQSIAINSLFPNPTKHNIIAQVVAKSNSNVLIHVLDITGKSVMRYNAELIEGENNISISTELLQKGAYILQITGETTTIENKFVRI